MTTAPRSAREMILVVEDNAGAPGPISTALQRAGYHLTLAPDAAAALARVAEATPDLILAPVSLPEMDGGELLRRLRADPATAALPVILLAAEEAGADVVTCLDRGADDCLTQPVAIPELLLRVRARLDRPLLPPELQRRDPQTGLLGARAFEAEVERELARARGRSAGALAYLELEERAERRAPAGARARQEIARQVAMLLQAEAGPLEIAGRAGAGRYGLLLPEQRGGATRQRLAGLTQRIAAYPFAAGGEQVHLTPVIGHARLTAGICSEELQRQALAALDAARSQFHQGELQHSPALAGSGKASARQRVGSWLAPWKAARTPS